MSFDSNGNYNKTNWKNGDIITADKLNKIEESLEIINNNDTSRYEETDTRLNVLEDNRVADKQEINAKVDEIVDNIEKNIEDINTINTNISNMNTSINNSLNTKVDKINGKGLSTNDYTTNEKNKLSGIENNANNYVHPATHNVSMIDGLSTVIDENLNPVKDEISNLNKELDKIKKIEETTVSTVVTENKITSVEETNNGYFNQIKLEGKTLVNVVNKPKNGMITLEQNLGDGNWINTTENSLITPSVKGKTIVNLLSSNPTIIHPSSNTVYLENNYIIHENLQGSAGSVNFKFKYIKPNTKYTVCYNVISLSNNIILCADLFPDNYANLNAHTEVGFKCYTFTTPSDLSTLECFRLYINANSYGSCKVSFPMIFEGDLTKTPELIPNEYVEGLKSSFEDSNHLGKYKVEYKTVGSNTNEEDSLVLYLNSPLLEGDEIKVVDGKVTHVHRYENVIFEDLNDYWTSEDLSSYGLKLKKLRHTDRYEGTGSSTSNLITENCISVNNSGDCKSLNLMYITHDGNIWLTIGEDEILSNSQAQLRVGKAIAKLKTPIYETISEKPILIDSFKNGHLQIDTVVPVIDVKTEPLYIYPYYLNASTEYLVQFHADRQGNVKITLDTAQESIQVQPGINKIYLTTSANVNPILKLSGNNIKIKDIMIVEKTDNEVEYFEGIKSVGDGTEEISLVTHKSPMRFGKGGRI